MSALDAHLLLAIPEPHKDAMNRIINTYNIDVKGIPDSGDNLAQPLGPPVRDGEGNLVPHPDGDPEEGLKGYSEGPATYRFGGWAPESVEEQAFYTGLRENPFVPPNGFPLDGGITEEQSDAACAALEYFLRGGANTQALPEACRQAMYGDLDVRRVYVAI